MCLKSSTPVSVIPNGTLIASAAIIQNGEFSTLPDLPDIAPQEPLMQLPADLFLHQQLVCYQERKQVRVPSMCLQKYYK